MAMGSIPRRWRGGLLIASLAVFGVPNSAAARLPLEALGLSDSVVSARARGMRTEALPDIFGPGAVLNVGNVHMKVTNDGFVGNPFPQLSSDPSAQWPGASGVEYLFFLAIGVGGVNPRAADPAAVRRVSFGTEWRPKTLDPEDRIYRAFDGSINGTRFFNDDNDFDVITGEPRIDEDFLDGRDNDGDGRIDEDFGALGQQMFSFGMWDNTLEAINTTRNEKHVPLGLECRQKAWAYSIQGFQDFNVLEYEIFNRSGNVLDSLVVGFLADMDSGPFDQSNYFQDDFDLPRFPQGEFTIRVGGAGGDLPDPRRRQFPHDPRLNGQVSADSALCPRIDLRINGFSIADDNGDENRTTGVPSVLLIHHTTDPLGVSGPSRVGIRAFRSFSGGTPYTQGGNPTIDQQRFEFMTGTDNVDQESGFVRMEPGETKGDFAQWMSVGPWRNVPDGGSVKVTIAFAVTNGCNPAPCSNPYLTATQYAADYDRYTSMLEGGTNIATELISKYPPLANAIAVHMAYEGIHERREEFPSPDFHGRETPIRLPPGSPPTQIIEDCVGRDLRVATVNDRDYSWFDFDCNYCTGVWDYALGQTDPRQGGLFNKTWNAAAPPPNPNTNVATAYNFSANPDRRVIPSRDRAILLAWDNLSEVTPDPKSDWFDFRGYQIWKVSDWKRPVGSPGPGERDWQLLGEYRLFDYEAPSGPIERNYTIVNGEKQCPLVFIPNHVYYDSLDGRYKQGRRIPICLDRGDLWDRQSGHIIKPDPTFECLPDPRGVDGCKTTDGCRLHRRPCNLAGNRVRKKHYPIGRYQYLDREVKNGFLYFYSVTAFDSVFDLSVTTELSGRRSAVEAEGVSPQAGIRAGGGVWVVPNPYKGYARISQRPSSWDLTPNATDPTGTHIDFMGLPRGSWTIRIYTVAGDLVAILRSIDEINESIRPPVKIGETQPPGGGPPQPIVVPGFNRQQDNENDGQARWNLISRNGQDVVSGVYLFTVESGEGTQRGKFVVIR